MRRLTLVIVTLVSALIASQAASIINGPQPTSGAVPIPCDSNGVHVAYITAYSTSQGTYLTSALNITDIDVACNNFDLTGSVLQGSTTLASGGPVTITGASMTIPLSSGIAPAKLVTKVQLSIDDNRNATTIATTLSANAVATGSQVHDSATLTGQTTNAGGTVTYTVYSSPACTTVAFGPLTVTVAGGNVPNSPNVTFNTAGTFYWQAAYSGDFGTPGNMPSTSTCTSEVLTVQNATTIGTSLSAALVSTGASVHDSATLSGATGNAGGSVTYSVFTNNSCTGSPFASGGTKTVTNHIAPNSNNVTFNVAGTYYWQAMYSGDANNIGSTSPCTSEVLGVNGKVYLSSTPPAAGSCGTKYISGTNPGGSSTVLVDLNSTVTWANKPTTFSNVGAGTYHVTLTRNNGPAAVNFVVQIGYCNSAGIFVSLGSANDKFTGGPSSSQTVNVTGVTAHVLAPNEYFAVRIQNQETNPTNKQLAILTNGSSFITGPVQ